MEKRINAIVSKAIRIIFICSKYLTGAYYFNILYELSEPYQMWFCYRLMEWSAQGCEIRPNPALQIHNVIENMSREYYLGFCEILLGSFEIMPHSELCHFLDHPIYDIGMH